MRVNMATTVLMHCWQPIHKSKASMPAIDFHWNFYFINFFFHLECTIGYVSRMHKWFICLNWIVNEWARLQIIHSSIDANAPIEPDSVHLSMLQLWLLIDFLSQQLSKLFFRARKRNIHTKKHADAY